MHKLVTIAFSHYNEKARWALDRFGVAYDEERYMPGLHAVGVLKLAPRHGVGKKDRHSSPLATPVLVTDEDRCIRGSANIVRYVSDRFARAGQSLYPNEEAGRLEERFSDEIGPHARRYAYLHAFERPELVGLMARANVSERQAKWFLRLQPVLSRMVARTLRVTPESAARSLARARAEIDRVSAELDGKRYLVGDTFTAADLAFACMVAPLVVPTREEGYGATFPPVDECTPEFAANVREIRETPAGTFALRMFREERGRHAP